MAYPGLALAPALLVLAAASVPLAVIDVREHRLPNRITVPLVPAIAALLALAAWGTGAWDRLARALLAGAALFLAYLLLHVAYPAGMGFGDVKLAPTLGMALGWWSWDAVLWGTVAAFALSAASSLALLASRRASLRSAVPFGPFMLAGAWIVIALHLLAVRALASPGG